MSDLAAPGAPYIVAIGGGPVSGSTSERALRLALAVANGAGARTELFTGAQIDLAFYDPTRPERSPAARRLVEAMRRADGILIGSPSYHGGLSGLVKNAVDYAEDLKDEPYPYLDGRAVGCIVSAAGWQGGVATLAAMRSMVHALRGWPTPLGVVINTSAPAFGERGECLVPALEAQIGLVAAQVLEFALARRALAG